MPKQTSLLDLSGPAFAELRLKLFQAGHRQFVSRRAGHDILDLTGVEVRMDPTPRPPDHVEIASILSQQTKEGKVELKINDQTLQMDLAKAREIRAMLDGAIEAAVSDQLIFTFLTQNVGLSASQAAAALLDFRELRQGSRGTVHPS